MKKRAFILIFALITVFCAVGCENVTLDDPSSEESSESGYYYDESGTYADDESDRPAPEPITELHIITTDSTGFKDSETTPKTVSAAVKRRNDELEEKYRIALKVTEKTEKTVINEAKAAVQSGKAYCDILSLEADSAVSLQIAGALYDMNTLPSFDLDSDSFSESAKSLATNKTLYLLPDASNLVYDDAVVLFYNRDLISASSAESPETLAAEGNWTWDKFNQICKTAAKRVYSVTIADMEKDTFGFASYWSGNTHAANMWASTGQKVIKNTYKSPVEISLTVAEVTSFAGKLRSTQNSKGRLDYSGSDAEEAFESGRLVFLETRLSYIYRLRGGSGKGENYGFVPMPKFDTNQTEYSTPTLSDVRVFAVPYQGENADSARLSAISKALTGFAETSKTVAKGYENQYLAQYLSGNSETLMLETVMKTLSYDFSEIYGASVSEIRRGASEPVTNYIDYGSRIDTSFANARKQFKNYVDTNFNN